MVIIYCLVSFMLGWGLSRWAINQPIVVEKALAEVQTEAVNPFNTPLTHVNNVDQYEQPIDAAPLEFIVEDADSDDDDADVWYFDTKFLDDKQAPTAVVDTNVQVRKYFMDNFHDEAQRLSQRIVALKAVLSIDPKLPQDSEFSEYIYHILLTADETTYPEETAYLLGLIAGRICSQRLPGLATYLKAGNAQVREEALKAIAPADTEGKYRKHVEFILNNDPQTEVRALAFVMLEQYYPHNTVNAA